MGAKSNTPRFDHKRLRNLLEMCHLSGSPPVSTKQGKTPRTSDYSCAPLYALPHPPHSTNSSSSYTTGKCKPPAQIYLHDCM